MTDAQRGATLRPLVTPDDAEEAIKASHAHPVLLYKHSPICHLSALAHEELDGFLAQAAAGLDVRIVDVLAARTASQWVEERTGIRHESPQALLLARGEVVWSASHRGITAAAMTGALARTASE